MIFSHSSWPRGKGGWRRWEPMGGGSSWLLVRSACWPVGLHTAAMERENTSKAIKQGNTDLWACFCFCWILYTHIHTWNWEIGIGKMSTFTSKQTAFYVSLHHEIKRKQQWLSAKFDLKMGSAYMMSMYGSKRRIWFLCSQNKTIQRVKTRKRRRESGLIADT